ncbi:MAG: TerB family tellurite resistance protein [Cyanobacteria bacterium J06638_7]
MTAPDPAPTLLPAQWALLRLVCWVAMADGDVAEQERQLLETVVARTLPEQADAAADAVELLLAEALQPPELTALVADLASADARQLAVKLAFQMACVNQRPEDAAAINPAEKRAYRLLLEQLQLADGEVAEAEWAARQELQQGPSLQQLISGALARFGAWPALEDQGAMLPGTWL